MLKVGVFGTGHLGKFHLNNWKEIKGVQLAGFYDPDDKVAAEGPAYLLGQAKAQSQQQPDGQAGPAP